MYIPRRGRKLRKTTDDIHGWQRKQNPELLWRILLWALWVITALIVLPIVAWSMKYDKLHKPEKEVVFKREMERKANIEDFYPHENMLRVIDKLK